MWDFWRRVRNFIEIDELDKTKQEVKEKVEGYFEQNKNGVLFESEKDKNSPSGIYEVGTLIDIVSGLVKVRLRDLLERENVEGKVSELKKSYGDNGINNGGAVGIHQAITKKNYWSAVKNVLSMPMLSKETVKVLIERAENRQ